MRLESPLGVGQAQELLPSPPTGLILASKAQEELLPASLAAQFLSLAQSGSLGWELGGGGVSAQDKRSALLGNLGHLQNFLSLSLWSGQLGPLSPSPHFLLNSWRLVAGGN